MSPSGPAPGAGMLQVASSLLLIIAVPLQAADPAVHVARLRNAGPADVEVGRLKLLSKVPPTKDDYRADPPREDPGEGGRSTRALPARAALADGAVVVYRNTTNLAGFTPGANRLVADDLVSTCAAGGELTLLEFAVGGGGDGSGPGFSVTFELFDGCPGAGGQAIAGTLGTADLEDDDVFVVAMDFEGLGIAIPGALWLGLTLSNDEAFVMAAGPAELGLSADLIHVDDSASTALACNAWFGGYPAAQHASFYAALEVAACAGEDHAVGYRSEAFSGMYHGAGPAVVVADDVLPLTPQCRLTRLELEYTAEGGPFSGEIDLRRDAGGRPGDTIAGTALTFAGVGGGALETLVFSFDPPVTLPERVWITSSDDSADAGPVIAGGAALTGFSDDAFMAWNGTDWVALFFGGCQDHARGCGSFNATLWCAGAATELPAACCLDSGCADLSAELCAVGGGQWHGGTTCAQDPGVCDTDACATGSGDCLTAQQGPGCGDPQCCDGVCAADDFCCTVQWDDNCAALAAELCSPLSNDDCSAAVTLGAGTLAFDTSTATDDGPQLPEACDEGFGVAFGADVWYEFNAASCGAVTLSTCTQTDFDTRLAVYAGCDCPVDNDRLLGCNDDGEECAGFASRLTFEIEPERCYKIRLGGYNGDAGSGTLALTVNADDCNTPCPAGPVSFLDPPDGVVDARQPHVAGAPAQPRGIRELRVSAPAAALDPACWSVCEDGAATANAVHSVEPLGDGTLRLHLWRPLTAAAVTTVTYGNGVASARLTSHPGNVNGDSEANDLDVLALIDYLNGVADVPWGAYSADADHSGMIAPADIVAVTDLLNGAGDFEAWDLTQRPQGGSCP